MFKSKILNVLGVIVLLAAMAGLGYAATAADTYDTPSTGNEVIPVCITFSGTSGSTPSAAASTRRRWGRCRPKRRTRRQRTPRRSVRAGPPCALARSPRSARWRCATRR